MSEEEDPGLSSDTESARYPNESDDSLGGGGRDQPDELADGGRRQPGSEGSRSSEHTPSSGSGSGSESASDADERAAPDFLQSMVRAAAEKERNERRRAPGTWMPGPEDFDRDPEPGDDTQFGTDGPPREYTSRQLGIRLRPRHFDRLLQAAAPMASGRRRWRG